jgi:membrane protein DedA with SNARE-associated domain
MLERLEALLQLIAGIPVEMVYVLVGLGAAVENIFPPVPSDLAVLAGGILAERGLLQADIVFLVAWLSNLALALGVYLAAYRYGAGVFSSRWGRWLLRPAQLQRMSEFYDEYGTITVLVSRFFPVFRVLVPAFAGISRLGFWRTAIPLMIASAAWYAALIWAGTFFSRNLPRLLAPLSTVNTTAAIVAMVVAVFLGVLWWRSRESDAEQESEE